MNEHLNHMLHYTEIEMTSGQILCKVGSIDRHWHSFYEMEYIYDGEGIININGNDFEFSSGTVYFVTPNDFHSHTFKRDTIIKTVPFFDFYFEKNSTASNILSSGYKIINLKENDLSWINSIFDRIISRDFEKGPNKSEYYIGLLNVILMEMSLHKNVQLKSNHQNLDPIQHSIHYIHSHFREQLTLESIAYLVGYSPNYFCSEFKKISGMSFKKFLNEQRLKYAVTLLKTTDLSITEVAETSGFNSISYFLKVFNKKFGIPPKVYKKNQAEL